MEYKGLILLIIIGVLSSCSSKTCSVDESTITRNDSIISLINLNHLGAEVGEQPLQTLGFESYRLSILPLTKNENQFYSLSKKEETITFHHKTILNDETSSRIKTVMVNEKWNLEQAKWRKFEKQLHKSCFWTMPAAPKPGNETLDGIMWILEGYKLSMDRCTNRNYHWVGSKESQRSPAFIKLSETIISFKEE